MRIVRLLREGRVVYTGPTIDVQTDVTPGLPVNAVGSLSLGPQTAPGAYGLSVTVIDALAPRERSTATSVMDFTIEPKITASSRE